MTDLEYNDKGYLKHMKDLEKSYRATYRIVKDSMTKCAAEAKAAHKGIETEHPDTFLKEGMIEDLNIAINQMHTGREAGSKRGIHRKGAYDVDKVIDPLYIQSYFTPTNSRSPSTLSDNQIVKINLALEELPPQEWKCYVMARGYCASLEEIAGMLGVTISSVRVYLKRADLKIKKALEGNMFLQDVRWEYDEAEE